VGASGQGRSSSLGSFVACSASPLVALGVLLQPTIVVRPFLILIGRVAVTPKRLHGAAPGQTVETRFGRPWLEVAAELAGLASDDRRELCSNIPEAERAHRADDKPSSGRHLTLE
jgi:hypothetical protein